MLLSKFREMFCEMVEKKDASRIPIYYHPDLLIYTNGMTMNYAHFLSSHQEVYLTSIHYKIDYDLETFIEDGNKLAGRLFITTSRPNEAPKEIEVILIATYKEGKIHRVWELTYPDWTNLPAFKDSSMVEKNHLFKK